MASQTKNRALIIVNYNFHGRNAESKLTSRPGARREADRIFKALSKCHYAVKIHLDLTAKKIEELYEEECHADHGEFFVSILSSHGEEGIIYDCEGQPVQLKRIFQILEPERCHKLAGKPKIFFIQACRGVEIDQGVWLQTDSGEAQTECFSHYLSIPQDTAVMYSCSPGYASFINRWESMFLKALLDLLEGEECHLEVASLMTRISGTVALQEAKGKYRGGKEMPCFVTKMVREVYPFSQGRQAPGDLSSSTRECSSNEV
ncbi:caspase-3-like [Podarcis raffonei]|uniref:caspase-3-like n=1 Tax=Podarcis raffonei TaxID=65483 RepID=UPI0023299035|nr:caspase-3-like [Podarcis raffonei]